MRQLCYLMLLLLFSGCATTFQPGARQETSKPPLKQELTNTFQDEHYTLINQQVGFLIQRKLIPTRFAIHPKASEVDIFYRSHEIANILFETRHYEACIQFIQFLIQHIFTKPDIAKSFELIGILASYKHTTLFDAYVHNLFARKLDFSYTPYRSTLFFFQEGLPPLIEEGQLTIAFQMLDKLFAIYGPVSTYFDHLERLAGTLPLDLWLAMEDPQLYKSSPFRGLIYAKKIKGLYEQLQFTSAHTLATSFLDQYPNHPYVSRVRKILVQAKRRSTMQGLNVAILVPLSGPYESLGRSVLEGILYAFQFFSNDVATNTSMQGIQFFPVDTHKYKVSIQQRLSALIEKEGIIAILGPLLSHTHHDVLPVIHKYKIPLLSLAPVPVEEKLVSLSTLPVLNMRPSVNHQLQYILNFLEENLLPTQQLATIYPDNAYGRFQAQAFQNVIDDLGRTLVAAETYVPKNTRSYKNTVKKLLGLYDSFDRKKEKEEMIEAFKEEHQKDPKDQDVQLSPISDFQLLYLPTSLSDASIYIPMFKYFSAENFVILGTDLWQNPELMIRTGPYLKRVVIFDTFFQDQDSPAFIDFSDRFSKFYLSKFTQQHYLGYLVASTFLKALVNLPIQEELQPTNLLDQLIRLEGNTLLGQRWQISQKGTFLLDPIPLIVINKQFTRFEGQMLEEFRVDVFNE